MMREMALAKILLGGIDDTEAGRGTAGPERDATVEREREAAEAGTPRTHTESQISARAREAERENESERDDDVYDAELILLRRSNTSFIHRPTHVHFIAL